MVVLLDTMQNEFIDATGAWPEAYMLLNREGQCYKKTSFIKNGVRQLNDIYKKIISTQKDWQYKAEREEQRRIDEEKSKIENEKRRKLALEEMKRKEEAIQEAMRLGNLTRNEVLAK